MIFDPVYILIMLGAIGSAAVIAHWTQAPLGLSRNEKLFIGLGAFCGAMIGAKLPFVLADWDGLVSGAAWFASGKTILCGLAGGYLGVEIAKWWLGVSVKTGDSFAVPVAVAVGIGRLACYRAGCCYGTPTDAPWGVVFSHVDALPRHPTQLYEAAFHLLAAGVLYYLWRRRMLQGQLIKLYIIAYAIYRFATELIRPEARTAGGLTLYQWAAIAIVAIFAWLWIRDAHVLRQRVLMERSA